MAGPVKQTTRPPTNTSGTPITHFYSPVRNLSKTRSIPSTSVTNPYTSEKIRRPTTKAGTPAKRIDSAARNLLEAGYSPPTSIVNSYTSEKIRRPTSKAGTPANRVNSPATNLLEAGSSPPTSVTDSLYSYHLAKIRGAETQPFKPGYSVRNSITNPEKINPPISTAGTAVKGINSGTKYGTYRSTPSTASYISEKNISKAAVPFYRHLPLHGEYVKKHDCLNESEKHKDNELSTRSGSRSRSKNRRPATRRHPLDMPEPTKSPIRPRSLDTKMTPKYRQEISKRKHMSRPKKKRSLSSDGKQSAKTKTKPKSAKPVEKAGNKMSEGDAPQLLIVTEDIITSFTGAESCECEGEEELLPQQSISERHGIDDYEYLQFLLRITEDIIRNDLYTNKDMKRVCNSHFEANKGRLDEEKMKIQIALLSQELGITFDDEIPCPAREAMKRRHQELKGTHKYKCNHSPIDKPQDKDYEDCVCWKMKCLPFQCSSCYGESEYSFHEKDYPPITDSLTSQEDSVSSEDVCFGKEGSETDLLPSVEDIAEGAAEVTRSLSRIKCICESLGYLSEHTEPDEIEKEKPVDEIENKDEIEIKTKEIANKCCGCDLTEEKTDEPKKPTVTAEFSAPQQSKSSKLLESCTVAPDFCSHLSNKLLESCKIMPDFCAEIHEEIPKVKATKSSCSCQVEKTEEDDGKKLLSVDYDLTPEKDEIKLPLDCTCIEDLYRQDPLEFPRLQNILSEDLSHLTDFKLKDLLLDDSYQIPEKPEFKTGIPTWFLKSVETQTSDSLHKLPIYSYYESQETISPVSSVHKSGTDVTVSTGSATSLTVHEEEKSLTPIIEAEEEAQETSTTKTTTTTTTTTTSTTATTTEESKTSEESPTSQETSEEKSAEKSTSTVEEGEEEEESETESEPESEVYVEKDEKKEPLPSVKHQYSPTDLVSLQSEFDSTDDEIDDYMVELNKKPVLSVTRSIEDRIASVTGKLEKFRQVNEVRTVSAAAALEENIKKTLSVTEEAKMQQPVLEEIKSSHAFEFIPPTLNASETDTGCCGPLFKKKQVRERADFARSQGLEDKSMRRAPHVLVADADQMQDPESKKNIRFSQMVIKHQAQDAQAQAITAEK